MVLIFLLGTIGSFLSGMLGIGGAIVQYPVLLYLPPLFGFPAFSAHDVTGMVAVQVFFTSMAGLVVHGKGGSFNQSLAVYMGTAVFAGSFLGGYGSKWLSETWIHFIYAILATLAVWMMFHSEKETKETAARPIVSHPATVMGITLVVGVFSGIIGSSGSFILVPVLLFVFKIPTRTCHCHVPCDRLCIFCRIGGGQIGFGSNLAASFHDSGNFRTDRLAGGSDGQQENKSPYIAGRLDPCHRHHIFENLV